MCVVYGVLVGHLSIAVRLLIPKKGSTVSVPEVYQVTSLVPKRSFRPTAASFWVIPNEHRTCVYTEFCIDFRYRVKLDQMHSLVIFSGTGWNSFIECHPLCPWDLYEFLYAGIILSCRCPVCSGA